jgi:urea transport system permease protein
MAADRAAGGPNLGEGRRGWAVRPRAWLIALLAGAVAVAAAGLPTRAAAAGPATSASAPAGSEAHAAVAAAAANPMPADGFQALLGRLKAASYAQKAQIIAAIARLDAPGAQAFLTQLLAENVYSREPDGKILIAQQLSDGYALTDPVSGKSAGTVSEDDFNNDFDPVGINDQLRSVIQSVLAQFNLSSPDAPVRLEAVRTLLQSFNDSSGDAATAAAATLLGARLKVEHDPAVRHAIQTGLALAALGSGSSQQRLAAIRRLGSSLDPDVYNRLVALTDRAAEPDPQVRLAAGRALRSIEDWREFYGAVQTLIFGLGLGAVLVLAAIGLAITFGVMGVINMAHGELIMLGAYTAYVMQLLMPNHIGASVVLAVPAAFLVSGLCGVLIERCIVRFLYGRPLETLLATFGLSLVLQQLARDVFSPDNRPVSAPSWMMGSLQINDALSITYNRLVVLLFTLLVFGVLLLIMKRTRLGLQVRAVSQNRAMARAMGVRSQWVDALAFGLGSGIAGIAGVALSQLTNVGPELGQSYIVDSFMVVVFGGVGNLWGTLIGGMLIGTVNMILEPYAGAVLGKVLVLVGVILFIQRRPRGLFPQRGRAAEG